MRYNTSCIGNILRLMQSVIVKMICQGNGFQLRKSDIWLLGASHDIVAHNFSKRL